jgi:hypothetical protein
MLCLQETHHHYSMDAILWECEREYEQVNQSESFQEYLVDVNKKILTHGMEYLVMWKNIFPHVMDEW